MTSSNRLFFYSLLLFIGIILSIETVESCSFSRNFGSGNSLSVSDLVGFNAAAEAGTTCSVSCDSGSSTQIYARYGGNADILFNDGSDFSSSSCSVSVAFSSSSEESQLGYYLSVRGPYSNLAISCSCTIPGDGAAVVNGGGDTACFSESATVQVLNRGSVAMKDLLIGDKVLTTGDKYQPIYAFGHYLQNEEQEFFQIHSNNHNNPLEMTEDHLIFIEQKNGKQKAVRADAVKVGDTLVTEKATTTVVTKITKATKKGMYMPLTPDGTLVVDGIKASAYISIRGHAPSVLQNQAYFGMKSEDTILHWWLSPIRMLCMGVSSTFCEIAKDDPLAPRSERGILKWLVFGRNLASFVEKQKFKVQVLVLGPPVFAFFAFLILMEIVFGPSLAPLAIAMIVAGLIIIWVHFSKKRRREQLI